MTIWPGGAWERGRAEGDADVVVFGDSITSGQNASRYDGRTYAQRLRSSLRSSYGDGGSGFSPTWAGAPLPDPPVLGGGVWMAGSTGGSLYTSSVPNGHVTTMTGGAATRLTLTAEGTFLALYLRRSSGEGTGRWRVDGGPWQALNAAGAAGYVRATADDVGAGLHTVDVEPVTGTISVAGLEGRNLTGCRVHIMGLGGRTSAGNAFGSLTQEDTAAFRAATIGRWSPHLLVVSLGVNDVSRTAGLAPAATYKANIEKAIVAARAARSDCDVVLVANALGKFANNNDYDAYLVALRQLVDTYGGLVVDLDLWARTLPDGTLVPRTTPLAGSAWARWAQWGWLSGLEAVHPNDVGHHAIAAVLERVLTASEGVPDEVEFETGGTFP